MRIKNEIENIDYQHTRQFFKKRADKYNADNPYSVTMYQDNNKELVKQRNQHETQKLLPFLELNKNSCILDLGCGIGRWADAIDTDICEYYGIDFSDELIELAQERINKPNYSFHVSTLTNLEIGRKFNVVLLIGVLMYLNDNDIISVLEQVESVCQDHAVICIREPIGLSERLTLKDFYSSELDDEYNAIYRTGDELKQIFSKTLLNKGFRIAHEGFVFDNDALNNRKETSQYFYILKR